MSLTATPPSSNMWASLTHSFTHSLTHSFSIRVYSNFLKEKQTQTHKILP